MLSPLVEQIIHRSIKNFFYNIQIVILFLKEKPIQRKSVMIIYHIQAAANIVNQLIQAALLGILSLLGIIAPQCRKRLHVLLKFRIQLVNLR